MKYKAILKIGLKGALMVPLFLLWLWTLGAAYYMAGGSRSPRSLVVAGGFVVVTALFLLLFRRYTPWWVLGTGAIGLVWYLAVQPSNDRDWLVEVARTPGARFDGNRVSISNIRNFHYRTPEDFDVSYYEKTYDLDQLDSVDLIMCYWDGNTAIAHTMLSFGFQGKDYLCLSVEIRREKGEKWGGLPGIYKQFEIIYILGDERDLLNLRTSYRKEDIYLYRMNLPQNLIRQYFEHMLRRINELNERPEFYDTLKYNCSSALTRMSKELWPDVPRPGGLRSLFNGRTDEDAHARGYLSGNLPFDELKKKSYITPIGEQHRDAPDFSQRVREGLPR